MNAIAVTVTLAPDADVAEMGDRLKRLGLTIEDALPEAGILFGRADPALLDQIRALSGVLEARPEETVQLPPLDDSTPQ